ncbi:MAG: 50S ribosomal protein L23 [Patescibacteria group bacterium]
MPLINKLKNIFKKLRTQKPKKVEPPEAPKERGVAKSAEAPTRRRSGGGKKTGEIYRVLKEPHISEKATNLFDESKYTFKVFPWAHRVQIKKAISDLYGVRVKDVKIINIKPKSRVLRGLEGKKPGYKKAIVVLEKGEKIEILPH